MDEDKFALIEKIIKDIENIMTKSADLCSFDVVPVDSNYKNKSPVLLIENCLGLESWCVKHVYMYCYSEIMDKYFSKPKRKTLKVTSVMSDRLTKLLNITLLLNPELSSFWNKRRELVIRSLLDKNSELQFTKLTLSRKPKCNDAFAYRRWLLDAIMKDDTLQRNYVDELINEELNICKLTSDRSPNNYHSWNHRMWFIKKLPSICKEVDLNFLYIKEYNFSFAFTSKHISDYSCFHYRQFCLKNIFTLDNDSWKIFDNAVEANLRKSFVRILATHFPKDFTVQASEDDLVSYTEESLVTLILCRAVKNCNCIANNVLVCRKLEVLYQELILNNEMLSFYKQHETLWYHRQYIVHEIIGLMYSHFGLVRQNGALVRSACKKCCVEDVRQKQAKITRYDSSNVYSSVLFKVLKAHELMFINERRIDGDNYADRHEKYLKFVEGLNNVM